VPTHCAILPNSHGPCGWHLKSWLVETSADGKSWREVARVEDNLQFNGKWLTTAFPVAVGGECHVIRLVNISRNHFGNDCLWISSWEIFGGLVESTDNVTFAFRPRAGTREPRSTGQCLRPTCAPSPPLRRVRVGRTMGTHGYPMIPSCRCRLQR
jgi:hypothetical protein